MKIKRTNKLKTNTSGFGHIEMLLIVVAVVVIGGVGFFVYQNQNKKTASKSTAHAGSWTLLKSYGIGNNSHDIYGCWNGQWGNYSEAKVLYTKQASANPANLWYNTVANLDPYDFDNAGEANAYWGGATAVQTVAWDASQTQYVYVYYGFGPKGNETYLSTTVVNIKAHWARC